ncbi:MAG: O-antigen ligase family protein [Armatimonadota bacterium]
MDDHLVQTLPAEKESRRDNFLSWVRMASVAWLLLVGLWSGPSLGATLVYPNGLVGVEAVLALVLILQSRRGQLLSPRAYPFLWPCLAVLGICALAALLRTMLHHTAFDWLRLWKDGEPMARGLLLFLAIAGQPRTTRLAWVSMLIGIGLLAGATTLQHLFSVTRWYRDLDGGWASGWQSVPGFRSQGLTSYINLTGAMLAASLPYWLLPLLMRMALSWSARAAIMVGGLLCAAGFWFTNSRGPAIAFGITALLAILAWGQSTWRQRQRNAVMVIVTVLLIAGFQAIDFYLLHSPTGWRLTEEGVSDAPRTAIYQTAITTIRSAPWLGIGDAAFAQKFTSLTAHRLHRLPATQRNAHNQFLQWAAAEGLPVAMAFSLLVVWCVLWCWRNSPHWFRGFPRMFGLATAMALLIFLLTNLTETHFWRIEGAGFFWSLLGVAAAVGVRPGE